MTDIVPGQNYFERSLDKGIKQGYLPAKTQESRQWFRDLARQRRSRLSDGQLDDLERTRAVASPEVGSMYLFKYDAKYKDVLPYWDALPLIFMYKKVTGGFYGFNVHYLQPQLRALMMDNLYDFVNNDKYDHTTKLKLQGSFLDMSAKVSYLKPCIKHYLSNHVRSAFTLIRPAEWDLAMFLPLAQWQNASYRTVYKQTRHMV